MLDENAKPLLVLEGIEKSFGAVKVLKGCDLSIKPKETMVIIGPSGSGKSTLLRCMNLLEPIDNGHILFEDRKISGDRPDKHVIRKQIGMVFQSFELFQHLSAVENIMLAPVKVLGMSRSDAARHRRRLAWQGPHPRQGGFLSR